MAQDKVIVTRGLERRFGETLAVQQLTLEVTAGEVFGFLGHNGAGKTTTVRLLNGVLAPTAGSVRVLGLDPMADGPALRRRTGVLTETPSLDERLTGRDNLAIYAELYDVPRTEAAGRVETMLSTFDLAGRAEEKVGGYSKGMKQRLALARALLHDPELLFLDEPTSGLDPVATRHVHDLIRELSRERRTVFLCTHNLAEAQQLCDRVAVLERGRVLAVGTPAELARRVGQAQRVEVEVAKEDVPVALRVVQGLNGARAEQQPDGTVSCLGIGHERVPELVSALAVAGVRVYRVAPQEPSLEEVYFALYGVQEGGR